MRRSHGIILVLIAIFLSWPAWAQTMPMPPPETGVPAQRISLDLKGVEIVDVLKLLSQQTGLNFVAGRNVAGRVTMFARDVDPWEAFELIASANELAWNRKGMIVSVMTTKDYEALYGEKFQEPKSTRVYVLKHAKSPSVATVLNQLKTPIGQIVIEEATNTIIVSDVPGRLKQMDELMTTLDRPTETRIYRLNYAEVEKMKEKLQEFLTPGVGIMSFDARTNTVIVTDMADAIKKIDEMIHALDAQTREVHIEARILQVTLSNEHSLGIDWQAVFSGIDSRLRSHLNVLDTSAVFAGTTTGTAMEILALSDQGVQILIDMLKSYGKTQTLSNPRLTASSGSEAKILVGTKEAFVTTTTTVPGSGGQVVSAPQVQFVDVGVKLFVTPTVKGDGHVSLKIRPEISRVQRTVTDIAGTRIPIVETTESETTVLAQNGMTLIIAGLIKTDDTTSRSGIPILGDLPVIGMAFRNESVLKQRNEIVVFLTPQIITPGGMPLSNFPQAPVVTTIGVDGGEGGEPPVSVAYQQHVRYLLEQELSGQLGGLISGPASLRVSFLVARDGRLAGEPQVSGSQDPQVIEQAKAAVKRVAPFPPFPGVSKADYVRFRLGVDFGGSV